MDREKLVKLLYKYFDRKEYYIFIPALPLNIISIYEYKSPAREYTLELIASKKFGKNKLLYSEVDGYYAIKTKNFTTLFFCKGDEIYECLPLLRKIIDEIRNIIDNSGIDNDWEISKYSRELVSLVHNKKMYIREYRIDNLLIDE